MPSWLYLITVLIMVFLRSGIYFLILSWNCLYTILLLSYQGLKYLKLALNTVNRKRVTTPLDRWAGSDHAHSQAPEHKENLP